MRKLDLLWLKRWNDTAKQLAAHNPETVVITGLRPSRGLPTGQLTWFLNDVLPEAFGPQTRVIHIPLYPDIERHPRRGEAVFSAAPARSGWQEPTDTYHVYIADCVGAVHEADLSDAAIRPKCRDAHHLHVFAHERNATPSLYTPESDPEEAAHPYKTLATFGYDIVLNGHRDIKSSAAVYNNVEASAELTRDIWVLTPPSAIAGAWRGFNVIRADLDGSFRAFSFTTVKRAWHAQQLATRSSEEAGVRRWRRQGREGPTCDFIDVRIENYEGAPEDRLLHERCGDIKVTMTLHRPKGLHDHLPLPLSRVVAYPGADWRAMKASLVTGTTREPLMINENGTINAGHHENEDVEIVGVLLNALPAQPGDWERMHALDDPQPALFLIQPSMAARLLRLRIDWAQLLHPLRSLIPVGRPEGPQAFVAVRQDDVRPGRHDVTIFRPIAGIAYAIGLDNKSIDPVGEGIGDPEHVQQWQHLIGELSEDSTGRQYTEIRTAVDTLRAQFVEVAKQLRPVGEQHDASDISVDLLGIDGQLHIVVSDSITIGARTRDEVPDLGNVSFEWGRGIAGRALRLGDERWWSRTTPHGHPGHPNTWSPHQAYLRLRDSDDVHAHIYSRPIVHIADGQRYPIGIISLGTYNPSSGLSDLIKHLRQSSPDEPVAVREVCEEAIASFTRALVDELKRHPLR